MGGPTAGRTPRDQEARAAKKTFFFLLASFVIFLTAAGAIIHLAFSPKKKQSAPLSQSAKVYGKGDVLVVFKVKVPDWTPREDNIYIYFDIDWHEPNGGFPMEKSGNNIWTLSYRASAREPLPYKYNRNNFLYATDEEFTPDSPKTWRKVNLEDLKKHQKSGQPLTVKDEVKKWRWLTATPPQVKISSFTPDKLPRRRHPFVLGMGMIDFHSEAFNLMIASTLERIRRRGFQYIQLTYYPSSIFLADNNSPTARNRPVPKEGFLLPGKTALRIYPGPAGSYSDAELDLFVREARKRGLKLMMVATLAIDPNNMDEIQSTFDEPQPDKWWEVGDQAWEEAMLRAAQKAARYRIEIFSPEIRGWGRPRGRQELQHHQRLTASFKKIRRTYPGILTTLVYPGDLVGFEWYQYLDWLADKWVYPLAESKETKLEEMTLRAEKVVRETYLPLFETFQKPILLQQVSYHANDGGAGGLMIGSEGPELAEWFPYNNDYPADFQEQADAYEALFQAVYDKPWVAGAFSFSYTYWDSYDKSAGIRGKPAEDVWARWRKILNPNGKV